MIRAPHVLVLTLLVTAGCGTEIAGPSDPGRGASLPLDQLLTVPVSSETGACFEANVSLADPAYHARPCLTLTDGSAITIESNGQQLALLDLVLLPDDYAISAEAVPPLGVTFTGVAVELDGEAAGPIVRTPDGLDATIVASLRVRWSARFGDGTPLPLSDQLVDDVELRVQIPDGSDELRLTIGRAGAFLDWSAGLELSDLAVSATGIVPDA